jgi:hypothetical protein
MKRSPETCQKISNALKGRKLSAEHIQHSKEGKRKAFELMSPEERWLKLSVPRLGYHPKTKYVWTDESRKRASDSHKGKTLPIETRQKLSIALKKHWDEHPEHKLKQSIEQTIKYSDKQERDKQRERAKISHSKPEVKKRISEGTKLGFAKHPEGRESQRQAMREWHKQHPHFCSKFGVDNPCYGKHPSTETRLKMSKAKEGRTGALTSNWKGGISKHPYSKEFTDNIRKIVRDRDNHTCQICGDKGNCVHHIDYNKQNNNLFNLISLCKKCHGKTGTHRKEWIAYFDLMRQMEVQL